MAEAISFVSEGGIDERGALEHYLREGIRLNCDDDLTRYMLAKPYEYSSIRQVVVNSLDVLPTAKYVLKCQLEVVAALDAELRPQGIDIFNLHGIVRIDNNNLICPPILEVHDEPPYNGRPVIVDGAHRLYTALQRGIYVNCIEISGHISSMLPVLPLEGWHQVYVYDTVPKDKRNYHPGIPKSWKPHELYRQQFPGSTGPRTVS